MQIFFCSGKKLKLGIAMLCLLVFGIIATAIWPQGILSASAEQQRLVPIYEVATEQQAVAISFDASWGAEHTETILDTLDEYDVKATFFLVNIWLEDYPEMAAEIARRGHEIGLHSTTHPRFSELSKEQILSELSDNCAMIQDVTGYTPTLFRPPFGDYNNQVVELVNSSGYDCIQWSVDRMV